MSNLKGLHLIAALLGGLAFTAAAGAESQGEPQSAPDWRSTAWHHVTVGVGDLDEALAQWIGMMGFDVRSRREGPDAGLASLWHIAPDDIERQAIVGTPGAEHGLIHLVQFHLPDPPVREGAQVYDLVPKNLDLFVRDMPQRVEELRAAGAKFRTDTYSDVETPGGGHFREIHMFGHDVTNVVLVETSQTERPYTDNGFSGVTQLISIVPDAEAEKGFYEQVMGLDQLSKNMITGPEIVKVVGLPPGSGLDVRIFGERGNLLGQMEVVDYQGAEGNNLYPLAKPKALGTLHVSYFFKDLAPLKHRLTDFGADYEENEAVETLFGSGPSITFHTPAGLRIEAHQRP